MRQLIVPTILLVGAIGLFVFFTNPTYQATKGTRAESAAYDDALGKSKELREIRDQKVAAFNTFTPEERDRLESILPDNVDNIHLIIDINDIAARHGLTLKNVSLGEISDAASSRGAAAVGPSGSSVGSVSLGFGFAASYDTFLSFLEDLQHSLRIMDIEKISFAAPDKGGDRFEFNLSVRTYWLH